ncbi:MAG: ABC transporter ATP-binding protein [Bacteroidales bacterium]|jgi:ABC-2 type transport system ATP-binding protein|nr:ABC transporter ATP-binding protein [Bacteroidales bacterium]
MIEIKELKFAYKPKKFIIDNMNLNIEKGKIHGLLGKNGTGKTTLLKLIGGLLFPSSGSLDVMGFKPEKRQVNFLSNLYFLAEEFSSYDMSIKSFVNTHSVFYNKFSKEQFYSFLEAFEITDIKQNLKKLSFGTRKKVHIAFALATNANLIVMDEPTNGLDIPSKTQFRKIVLSAMREDLTIIISTHQVRDLHNLIDNILIMDKGNIILNQTNEAIISKLYFGIASNEDDNKDILYSDKTIKGVEIVRENTLNEDTELDIELLFNAICTNKEKIVKLFNK